MKKKTFFLAIFLLCLLTILNGQMSSRNSGNSTLNLRNNNIPNHIPFQGRLADSSGNPVNGNVQITFGLYDVETGGTYLWSETQTVSISDGLFSVNLGSFTPLDETYFSGSDRWIGISVGSDSEMTPRTKLSSVPYAFTDDDWSKNGDDLYFNTGKVAVGRNSADTDLTVFSSEDQQGLTLRIADNLYSQGLRFMNSGGAFTWNIFRKDASSNKADLVFAGGQDVDINNLSPRVTFQNEGNVGIGTDHPDEKLSVVGKIRAANDADETEFVEITHGGDNGSINWEGDGNLDFRYQNTTLASVNQSGDIVAQGQLKNVTDPTDAQDAATKSYVDSNAPITYEVGDFAHSGIVFWVDETGQHGLVCAKEDQVGGSGIQWYNGDFSNTEAHGNGIFAGEMNTMLIIANQGSNSNDYAAGVCANYTYIQNNIMYGDWYLPSKSELNNMYQNKTTINATAVANGGSAFASDYYWSSTEFSDDNAWNQGFVNGGQNAGPKSYAARVRAIRAF